MEELLNSFGQTIKDARQAANLTQDELAEQAGITTRYIMAIENENKQPSMKVLFKLNCFGVIIKQRHQRFDFQCL